jgi:hypothetical protein
MVQGVAPARRVGIVLTPFGADYDSPIFDLFDAAIEWCMESAPDQVTSHFNHAASILRADPAAGEIEWQ